MAIWTQNYARPDPRINKFTTEPSKIDYEDDRIERLLEITNNLEEFYKENPDLFKNEEEFKKNFHFDERSWLQQALLSGFWKNKDKETPTATADTNEDIFWETAGDTETTPENWTERDDLVWPGSVADIPNQPDIKSAEENIKKDKAKRELEEADKNIKEGKQYMSPSKEKIAEDNKPDRASKNRERFKNLWL